MGFGTILLIVIITFLVFGPEKVPEVGRALGRAMREFRKAMSELERSVEEETAPVKKELTDTRETVGAQLTELRKSVSISESEPPKPPEGSQKSE